MSIDTIQDRKLRTYMNDNATETTEEAAIQLMAKLEVVNAKLTALTKRKKARKHMQMSLTYPTAHSLKSWCKYHDVSINVGIKMLLDNVTQVTLLKHIISNMQLDESIMQTIPLPTTNELEVGDEPVVIRTVPNGLIKVTETHYKRAEPNLTYGIDVYYTWNEDMKEYVVDTQYTMERVLVQSGDVENIPEWVFDIYRVSETHGVMDDYIKPIITYSMFERFSEDTTIDRAMETISLFLQE